MTPNPNASPLAALIANASSTSQGAELPLKSGGSISPAGPDFAESGRKFFNILQTHKVTTSSSTNDISPLTIKGPLLPAQGLEQLQAMTTATLAPASQGQIQPLPGMQLPAQALSIITQQKQLHSDSLEADAEVVEGVLPGMLSAPAPGAISLPAELDSGSRSPQSGNALPPGLNPNLIKGQKIPDMVQDLPNEYRQPSLSLKPVTVSGQDTTAQLVTASQTPAAAAPIPIADLASQMMKLQRPAPGASTVGASQSGTGGIAEISALVSEQDGAQPDLIRPSVTPVAVDRSNPVQQAAAPIPLPRMAGAPGWDQGLGQRIMWMVDNGLNQAELRLDPPQLGTVNVRISVQDDHAQLMFQAAHPAARDALESALPRLREMFAQQGLELGSADVSDHDHHGLTEGDNGQEQMTDDESLSSGRAGVDSGGDDPMAATGTSQAGSAGRDASLIDEFV